MKINIVCYEDPDLWILGKFAKNLQVNLTKLGIENKISSKSDIDYDINHHIIFNDFNGISTNTDTLMITHVDDLNKLDKLKDFLNNNYGICMSSDTMNMLINLGINGKNLFYVNPAHDNDHQIKKIKIGIFCRVQPDGRKREDFLNKLCKKINNKYFKFIIMGDSWDTQVHKISNLGFEVDYYPFFDKKLYYNLLNELDFYLYMGLDEGQMGVLDAIAIGINTIATKQGYHIDILKSITFPFLTYNELENIFLEIQNNRILNTQTIEKWSWYNYTLKHLEIWKYLLDNKFIESDFEDGLNSNLIRKNMPINKNKTILKLYLNNFLHKIKIHSKRF